MDIKTEMLLFLSEILEVNDDFIELSDSLQADLGVGSGEFNHIIWRFEDEFGIEFECNTLNTIVTVSDLINTAEKLFNQE